MFPRRSLAIGFLTASLGAAASLAAVSSPPFAAAESCGHIQTAPVRAVCERGGRAAVKKSMKAAMEAANATGGDRLRCASCHADQKEYALSNPNEARERFQQRMAPHFQ